MTTLPLMPEPLPSTLAQRLRSAGRSVIGFIDRNYFLVGVIAAVALAALCPSVGRRGGPLQPELTVAWGATCGIFLLAGLNLPTSELARAAASLRVHALVQSFNLAYCAARPHTRETRVALLSVAGGHLLSPCE